MDEEEEVEEEEEEGKLLEVTRRHDYLYTATMLEERQEREEEMEWMSISCG